MFCSHLASHSLSVTIALTSTCSVFHVSMLNDLTLEMWVPSFRCIEAHRMHTKIPRLQLAHPGLRAPQSAHRELPGTRSSSCSSRSLRACCLLLTDAMAGVVGVAKLIAEIEDKKGGCGCWVLCRVSSQRLRNMFQTLRRIVLDKYSCYKHLKNESPDC